MYITRPTRTSKNGKTYETVLLRESFREDGKVKNRTLANFTHCKPEEIRAIELALRHKNDLSTLVSVNESVELEEGLSVGAVWTVCQTAKRLGIEKALGADRAGQLALWQVIARVLEQGSRLSAARLAQTHAGCDVLGISRGFDEEDLYRNLAWLTEQQPRIETALFRHSHSGKKPDLFLYDVTSSYLEGEQNALADYGYNRDGKKGKKQIVIGLLTDGEGEPLSVEVFQGNTGDVTTLQNQIQKVSRRFGCERATFVGDRGMIKSAQMEALSQEKFHYITAIAKPQIQTLLKQGVLQMELFDEDVCEVEQDGVRYVLRRNPRRAEEMALTRNSKQTRIETLIQNRNEFLQERPRAKAETARQTVEEKIKRFGIQSWMQVEIQEGKLVLLMDEAARKDAALLDGCYVLKTGLPTETACTQTVHDRYKDLAEVEQGFRTCKTSHLEIRPVYVRTEESTRGHVLVVMLAYKIVRELQRAWQPFNLTVEEGIHQLSTLCSTVVKFKDGGTCQKIPKPREQSQQLLEALNIRLPEALPHRNVKVVTRRTLPSRRKTD